MKTNIKIKDYSRSRYFNSLEELKTILEYDYMDRVITLYLKASSGKLIPPCRLVITPEGYIQETCGNDLQWDRLALTLEH